MKRSKLTAGLLSLILGTAVQPVFANDWPQWRGPEQTGVSREKGLPSTWDPDTGENLLWKNDKVSEMSSPVTTHPCRASPRATVPVPVPRSTARKPERSTPSLWSRSKKASGNPARCLP